MHPYGKFSSSSDQAEMEAFVETWSKVFSSILFPSSMCMHTVTSTNPQSVEDTAFLESTSKQDPSCKITSLASTQID